MPSRPGQCRRIALALGCVLLTAGAVVAEEAAPTRVLDWETGAGKSYWIPALEVGGFIFGLNQ
ncbi:MAG TPA: hypothetical protein VEO00_03340, partial [Actinomycetota bacterium]|nr:hypothetical protein [Actinomycetota bacterium]